MSNLEQRAAAYSLLVAAKQVLGLSEQAFAEWLVGEAMEMAPQLFDAADDLDDDGLSDTEGWAVN